MNDLEEGFGSLSRLRAPDLWPRIRGREPGQAPAEQPRSRRPLIAAAALLVALGGLIVAIRAFVGSGEGPGPATSPSTSGASLSGRVVDRIAIDDQVGGVLAAYGTVWIQAMEHDSAPILLRVDPSTDEIDARLPIDASPPWEVGGGAMAAGYGSLWVTGTRDLQGSGDDYADAVVDRIDPGTGEVTATFGLGGQFGADIAIGESGVWVATFGDRQVEVIHIDPSTNRVIARIPLDENYVRRILVLESAVVVEEKGWREDQGPHTVLQTIDAGTNQLVATEAGDANDSLGEIAAVDGQLWATSEHEFIQLDPATLQPVAPPVRGGWPNQPLPVITTGSGAIWFVGRELELTRFDPDSGVVDQVVKLPGTPIALAVDRNIVWCLDYDGTLLRVEVTGS